MVNLHTATDNPGLDSTGSRSSWGAAQPASAPVWSVIVPFFNEREWLPVVLRSLAAQTIRPQVILVDNASTDRSGEVARQLAAELELDAVHLWEGRPGKVAALQAGLAEVRGTFVATCDADTDYPADYLAVAMRLLARPGTVCAIAANTAPGTRPLASRLAGLRLAATARLLPQQCLNGGASQVFRTAALKACGGFDPAIWNWVLEDHEVIARIEGEGRIAYAGDFVCHPAARPRGTDCTGWNLGEQLHYHATRGRADRLDFFHRVLGPRLRDRALSSEKLRRTGGLTASAA